MKTYHNERQYSRSLVSIAATLMFESINVESVAPIQHAIVEHADDSKQTEVEFSSSGGWVFNPTSA